MDSFLHSVTFQAVAGQSIWMIKTSGTIVQSNIVTVGGHGLSFVGGRSSLVTDRCSNVAEYVSSTPHTTDNAG